MLNKKTMSKKDDVIIDEATAKRRKKFPRSDVCEDIISKQCESETQVQKPVVLPQKKRTFVASSSPSRSPAKKTSKTLAGNNSEEPVDDEALIRETEAALKSLSGSWHGPRGSFYNRGISEQEDRFDSPPFENLFEEKNVNNKISPSSQSTLSVGSDNSSCSLKDVITLRDQHQDPKNIKTESTESPSSEHQNKQHDLSRNISSSVNAQRTNVKQIKEEKDLPHGVKNSQEGNDLENLLKIENECASIQSQKTKSSSEKSQLQSSTPPADAAKDKFTTGSRYEPDFNELVDDSSNELEIDMSDPSGDKDEDDENSDRTDLKQKKKDEICIKKDDNKTENVKTECRFGVLSQNQKMEKSKSNLTGLSLSSSATFSSTSAFRPVPSDQSSKDNRMPSTSLDLQTTVSSGMSPIGPFPAGATFVGYPGSSNLSQVDPQSNNHNPMSPLIDEKPAVCLLPLKPTAKIENDAERHENVNGPSKSSNLSVSSPEAASAKQYTILQPAGAGSRAATAIQDVARDGVLSVSAVSSSSAAVSSTQNISSPSVDSPSTSKILSERTEANRSVGPMSPTSLSKGQYLSKFS